jgi:tetratricopeptide (TPR) repeat protein
MLILTAWMVLTACAGPELADQKNDMTKLSMAELDSGNILYRKGCYHQSLTHFFRAFELFTLSDSLEGVAMCLNNIGNVYNSLDSVETALLFYDEAYTTYTALNDMKGAIHALTNKAASLIAHNRLSRAEEVMTEAERISTQTRISFPQLTINRGILLTKKQEFAEAELVLKRALTTIDSENTPAFASVHFALGTLMMKTDRHAESLSFFHQALHADQRAFFQPGMAENLSSIGDAMVLIGRQKEAISYYKRSLLIYALINRQGKKEELLNKLEAISQKGISDLSIVHFFLDQWRKDNFGNAVCN